MSLNFTQTCLYEPYPLTMNSKYRKSCQNLGAYEEPTKIDEIDKERQARVINNWVERHKEQLEAKGG